MKKRIALPAKLSNPLTYATSGEGWRGGVAGLHKSEPPVTGQRFHLNTHTRTRPEYIIVCVCILDVFP